MNDDGRPAIQREKLATERCARARAASIAKTHMAPNMTYLECDAGASALVRALQEASRTPNKPGIARHELRFDRALDAIVPELLAADRHEDGTCLTPFIAAHG
jgi:hypothetical protein